MRFRNLKKQSKKNSDTTRVKPKYIYARYTDRVKAFITDMFMIYIPTLYAITYVALNGKEDFQASWIAQLSGVLVYALIYSIFLSKSGQTPGKRAYDIKVVDAKTGEQISFLRALLRFFSFLVSATVLLGVLLPFFRKDRKSLHDLMASTLVVKEKKE
jgi:uncharacterized RDD family membrane protein YckC